MIAGMKRRLEQLERRRTETRQPSAHWPLMLWNMQPLPKERIENLRTGERVVLDWVRDIQGIVWMRERIAVDQDDRGRRCEPGGYLADVLEEIHQECDYRTKGSCRACAGTPLSETPTAATRSSVDPSPD